MIPRLKCTKQALLFCILGGLVGGQSIVAQTTALKVQIVSSVLDTKTHDLAVTLLNASQKVVVATDLTVVPADDTHPLGTLHSTTDSVALLAFKQHPDWTQPDFSSMAQPGAETIRIISLPSTATKATIAVTAVIYDDLTAEGDSLYIDSLFQSRQFAAAGYKRALATINQKWHAGGNLADLAIEVRSQKQKIATSRSAQESDAAIDIVLSNIDRLSRMPAADASISLVNQIDAFKATLAVLQANAARRVN
jgi:hypothetical protein